MEQTTRLREVSSTDLPPRQPDANQQASQASVQLLILALKTLSQRTIVGLAALRGLALAGTVFWLAYTVVQAPSALKLTGLGIYAVFVLIAEFMTRRV